MHCKGFPNNVHINLYEFFFFKFELVQMAETLPAVVISLSDSCLLRVYLVEDDF